MRSTMYLNVLASLALATGALAASRVGAKEPAIALPIRPADPAPIENLVLGELPRLRTQLEAWLASLGALERDFGDRVGQIAALRLGPAGAARRPASSPPSR